MLISVFSQRLRGENGGLCTTESSVKIRISGVEIGQAEEHGSRIHGVSGMRGCAWDFGKPSYMNGCMSLSCRVFRGKALVIQFAPAGQKFFSVDLKPPLLVDALGMPPAVRLLKHLATPPLGDFPLITIIETFEHHVHPGLSSLPTHHQGVFDRSDTAIKVVSFSTQSVQMTFEGFNLGTGIIFISQCGSNTGQGEASIPQKQDALKARNCDRSVVTVPIVAYPVRSQKADLVVVTQCSGADTSPIGEFTDSPFHSHSPPIICRIASGPTVAGQHRGSQEQV